MEKMDKNVLLDLVNKYGVEEIEKFIDIKKEILNYIYETKKLYTINAESRKFGYNEDNKQIFTNSRTSIFCLNEKILSFNKLKLNSEVLYNQMKIVNLDEINNFFEKAKRYFGNSYYSDVSLINTNGFTYYKTNSEITTISLNEYKLIRLLLKNPKMYAAGQCSALYVEGENGFAYVLGEKNGCQTIF